MDEGPVLVSLDHRNHDVVDVIEKGWDRIGIQVLVSPEVRCEQVTQVLQATQLRAGRQAVAQRVVVVLRVVVHPGRDVVGQGPHGGIGGLVGRDDLIAFEYAGSDSERARMRDCTQ